MSSKADFLKDCLSDPALVQGPIPIDEFTRVYCLRCQSRECSRSRANGMLFDQRVGNWQEKLFINPAQAKEGDPGFDHLRNRNFLPIIPGVSTTANSGFVSREQPSRFVEPPTAKAPDSSPSDAMDLVWGPVENAEDAVEVEPPPSAPPTVPTVPPSDGLENTPFQQGQMLPGAPPQEIILQPGQSFTLGDD